MSLFSVSCSSVTVANIDPALTIACDKPLIEGRTWRDLAAAFVKRGEAIDNCNRRLKVIREGDRG
jgi:hypothetical protein